MLIHFGRILGRSSLLTALCLSITISSAWEPALITASANRDSSVCEAPASSFDRIAEATARIPDPASKGTFHGFDGIPDPDAASYNLESSDGQVERLEIDGEEWISRTSWINVYVPATEPNSRASFDHLTSITAVLAEYSACIGALTTLKALTFFTDQALAWACSAPDLFLTQSSPAGFICSGAIRNALGALPLVVFDARELSDGRIGLLVGEGSTWSSDLGGFSVPASVWIMLEHEGTWYIDGVIGGISFFYAPNDGLWI